MIQSLTGDRLQSVFDLLILDHTDKMLGLLLSHPSTHSSLHLKGMDSVSSERQTKEVTIPQKGTSYLNKASRFSDIQVL